MLFEHGDQLGVRLLGDRLAGADDALAGSNRVLDRIDAAPQLGPAGHGDEGIEHDGRLIECAHQTAQGALAHRGGQVESRRLGLLHEVGKGENGISRDDPFGLAPAQCDGRADLASYRPGIGHAAGKRLCQEMGAQLLDLPPIGRVGKKSGFLGTQTEPSSHSLGHGVGSTPLGGLGEIGKEAAGGGERGIVGGGAEAVDRLRGERAGLTFPCDFLG